MGGAPEAMAAQSSIVSTQIMKSNTFQPRVQHAGVIP